MVLGMYIEGLKQSLYGVLKSRMELPERKELRWMYGVTRKNRIRNGYIRGKLRVIAIEEKNVNECC